VTARRLEARASRERDGGAAREIRMAKRTTPLQPNMLAVRVLAYALVSEIPQHQPNGRGRATVPSRRHEYSSP